jgi:hypothetical protein
VGQLDPVAPCNYCEPKGSPHEWATLPDGKACGGGDICYQEVCCPRTSNCAGLECGDDGCGGNCGSCGAGFFCIDQLCIDPTVCDDGNSVDWDGCTGGQVTEFRTNTYTSSNQQDPSVAVLKSGGYVIVWESDGPDEKWGVYGQRYGADGAKLGSQFRANKVDLGKENLDPDVAATVGGGFVIVWYAQEDINEFGNVIVSRRFGDDGIAIGSDITLPQYKSGSQERPAVTGLQDGGFAAVWDNDGSQDSQGIYLRLFDADGEAQGDQIPVNTVTSNNQLSADLVQLDSGSVVVVWVSKDQDGNGHGIFGRRFNSKGVGQESEVQLNSYFAGDQLGPRIAALDSGDFVVTWYQEGPDDNSGIMARRFSKAVIPVSDQFTVNSTLPEKQEFPCVGTLPGDAFIAAWQSQNQDGDGSGVYFRRHDSGNTPLGNDARANIYTTQAQTYPDCAGFGSGNFIIVWQSKNQDGNGEGIFHQRFHAEGYRLYP